jgi:hypothetical protein
MKPFRTAHQWTIVMTSLETYADLDLPSMAQIAGMSPLLSDGGLSFLVKKREIALLASHSEVRLEGVFTPRPTLNMH